MADRIHRLRLFISSPTDVLAERQVALEVINVLQYEPQFRESVCFEVVSWEELTAEASAQSATLQPSGSQEGPAWTIDCDLLIMIRWRRMGPPLPSPERTNDNSTQYYPGAEWIFEAGVDSNRQHGRPDMLVYRRTQKALLDDDAPRYDEELAQKKLLKNFFGLLSNADTSTDVGGYTSYETPEDFRGLLTSQLRAVAANAVAKNSAVPKTESLVTGTTTAAQRFADWSGSPFPGPRPFTHEEAPVFFGRGRETDDLADRVNHGRFVTVIGAAGSGKSSLVWAGLIPRLEAGAIVDNHTDSRNWLWLRFTPGGEGANPFLALATKLLPFLPGSEPQELAHKLQAEPASLAQLIPQILSGRPDSSELLLFVDNWEELVTLVTHEYRAAFAEMLCLAVAQAPCRGVGTLRTDFYPHMMSIGRGMVELLKYGSYPLGAPDASALQEIVLRPAERAGLRFENDLNGRIVQDTGTDPDAISFLAYVLDELYRQRVAHGHLTQRAYDDMGGVAAAIATRAELVYQALSPSVQSALPQTFLNLVDVDEHGAARRRRMRWEKLGRSVAPDLVTQVLSAFVEARLLVTDQEGEKRTVELAHEALLRKWARLADWIEQKREDLRLLRRVKLAAAEWEQNSREDSLRWPDDRLKPVHAVAHRLELDQASELTATEKDFISREHDRTVEEINNPNTPHIRRSWIGERLTVIGDSRPHVGLRESDGLPDIGWCKVDFPGKSWAEVEIEGGSSVKVYLPFYIARYPVTYTQFQAFVAAPDGYNSSSHDWFQGMAADARDKQLEEQHFKFSSHPREMVNWYQAMAFCRWLSWRYQVMKTSPALGGSAASGHSNTAPKAGGSKGGKTAEFNPLNPLTWRVRLPTEAEWQFAAAGPTGRKFPWGQDWDPRFANTLESCLSRTTAVGMYPAGTAPCGALDMSGNVWEWTLTEYTSGQSNDITNAEPRAGRGGSWIHNWSRARTAARGFSVNPDYRFDSGGFRLLATAPLP